MKKGIRLVSSAIILGYLLFAPMALAQSDKEQVRFSWQNFSALKNYVDVPVKYTTEFSLQQANILSQAIHFFTPKKKAQVTSAVVPTPTPIPNLPIPPPHPSLPPVPQKQISNTPIIVQLPSPVATPSSNAAVVNSGRFLNKADVVAEIQRALTKALGTAPYTDGTSFPYYPVYKQIAEQGHSTAESAQKFTITNVTNLNGVTSVDLTGTGSVTLSGALGVSYGGTGLSSAPTYGKVLLGNSSGGYDLVSTSSLGISNSFSGTTDNITQGSVNKYYDDNLVNAFVHGSTTIPKTYTSNTFTNSNTFSGGVTLSNLIGWIYSNGGSGLAASSSPTINYIVATSTTISSVFPYASTTAISSGTICLTGDTCRTTWPTAGASADWNKQSNYNVLSLTPTTTIPVWFKDQVFASSSAIIAGLVTANNFTATGTIASTFPYASSTALTATTFFGTNATTTSFNTSSLGIGSEYFTDLTGSGLAISGSTLTCNTASGSVTGCLSSTDWSTFNSKANIDWNKQTNYNVLSLTPTTTIPVWFKDQLFASSSAIFAGTVTANNFTATGTAVSTFTGGVISLASSTLQNVTAINATTTNATSTTFFSTTHRATNETVTNSTSTSLYTSTLGINSEYFTDLTGSGLTIASNALTCATGNGSTFGCLTSTDWNTFNGKASIDWSKQTNYNVLSLTPTTTIPVWFKDQVFASSSAIFAGLVTANNFTATGTIASTFPYASSTALTATTLFSTNYTTTNATTTAFYVSGVASIGSTTPWATLAVNPVAGAAANQFVVGSSTATNFIIKNTGSVGVGTSTPGATFAVNGNDLAQTYTAYGTSASVLPYASSTALTATNFFSTTASITNLLTSGSTTLQNFTGLLATTTNATSTNLFATNINATGATTSALSVTNIASVGTISVSSSTPSSNLSVAGTAWLDLATLNLASSTAAGLTVNYLASTTNVVNTNRQNAWAIASSTSSSNDPVFNISMSSAGATSTVGFFVSTSTGLIAGVGNPIPSALKNYVIVGNGRVQAGMAIVKGGLCVDSDGWCTASTTGVISTSGGVQTANSDLAEIYYSDDALEPGDVVTTSNPATYVTKADVTTSAAIGVVSTKPGLVLGLGPDQENQKGYPIALAGRVPIKVSASNGPIKTGDFLTLSSIPGVTEKVTGDAQIVAQALEAFDDYGVGKIMAIVRSSFYKAPNTEVAFLKTVASSTDQRIMSLENEIKEIKGLTINSIGSEGVPVSILSDANFFGRPYFTNDTVGSALIKKGARTVAVTFDRDYTDAPEVQATLALNEAAASTGADEAVFSQDVRFVVTQRSIHGFVIKINKPAPADITFSWLALAAKNTKLFSSTDQPVETVTVSPSPAPVIVEPSPAPSTPETTEAATTDNSTTTPVTETSTTTEPVIDATPVVTPEVTPETATPTPSDAPVETPAQTEPTPPEPVTEITQ